MNEIDKIENQRKKDEAIIKLRKTEQKLQKANEQIAVQKANEALEDEAYVCEQNNNSRKPWRSRDFGLLFLWEAIFIIAGLFGIYLLWNNGLFDILSTLGMPVPAWGAGLFKLWGYVFFAGMIGSASYAICCVYNHIVSPRGNSFTSVDDQDIEEEAELIAKSGNGVYTKAEGYNGYKTRKEQRRFCAESRTYWILRPLLGGVGGIFSYILFFLLSSAFLSGVNTVSSPSTKVYVGVAFISGMCFGDFVKFVGEKSRQIFRTTSKDVVIKK